MFRSNNDPVCVVNILITSYDLVVPVEADISKFDDICSYSFRCSGCLGVLARLHNKKNLAQTSSAIAIAKSIWERSSIFNRMIIGNDFYCFTPGSACAYPLKVCSNRN